MHAPASTGVDGRYTNGQLDNEGEPQVSGRLVGFQNSITEAGDGFLAPAGRFILLPWVRMPLPVSRVAQIPDPKTILSADLNEWRSTAVHWRRDVHYLGRVL